ncbi:MAG: hypothetical protein ACO4CT_18600, partial [Planctomycetota bacterium]
RTHHALPHETALKELGKVEGDQDIESDRSADELRLEIAQRCAMHVPSAKVEIWRTASGHERLGAPLDRVETMLDRLMACATASRIVRGRARAWRATIRYRTARQLQDAAAKLGSVESTAEDLRLAIDELRQEEADVFLLPALQTQIEVFATLIDILPAEGGQAAWPSLLGEGREVGCEALELAGRLRQHRVQRSLEGALGRLNQAAAVRHLGLSDQDASRECFRVASDHFERNFDSSEKAGDRSGMVLMPSSLVLCSYALGDVGQARKWCQRYGRMLVAVRSEAARDGDPFLRLHRYVLSGAPTGDLPHAERAWSHEWIRPMRGVLRTIYAPHLDHLTD